MDNLRSIEGSKRDNLWKRLTSKVGNRIISVVITLILTNIISLVSIISAVIIKGAWLQPYLYTFMMGAQALIIFFIIWVPLNEPDWLDDNKEASVPPEVNNIAA